MTVLQRLREWPWLTLQIIAANVAIILALATAWYLVFTRQSSVYSDRLMSTFNIEPGSLHAMYVDDVERQLWVSVTLGLVFAILASVGLAFLIVRPLRSLARATERLRHGDYGVRSTIERGEVGRLAKNFNALAAALEQEERRRAQFMTDLSHELRTPITSLRGYTEGLEDGVFQADENYFKLLAAELSHLVALTHTIESMQLNTAKANGEQADSVVGIEELLQSAKISWEARFHQRDLRLEIVISNNLTGQRFAVSADSMKQIIDNLLSNMYRYAAADAPCRIEGNLAEQSNFVTLSFSNHAPDVTDDVLPFLFDRFYRISQSRTRVRNEQSSGLGLSVVKQLCIANKGNVSASLDAGRLVFTVYLPIRHD